MFYEMVKQAHIALVIISGLGFAIRGFLSLKHHPLMNRKWIRIAPHIIDTLMLITAVCLCVMLNMYPLQDTWLTLKTVMLILYIALGIFAMKKTLGNQQRWLFYVLALICYAFIYLTAINRAMFYF